MPAQVFHFPGTLGHPVLTQDPVDDLHFVELTDRVIRVKKVSATDGGEPRAVEVGATPHGWPSFRWPPHSPQKGTEQRTASGDQDPKNLVMQGGFIWFSHTIHHEGRAAVQWHQIKLDGSIVQSGLIADSESSFIQTTIAVNRDLDVLVGFQETSPDMFISPRLAFRRAESAGHSSAGGGLGEGLAATSGLSWGDYSGSVVDELDGLEDLWTIQSIAGADGRGDTVICRVPAAFGNQARAPLNQQVPACWEHLVDRGNGARPGSVHACSVLLRHRGRRGRRSHRRRSGPASSRFASPMKK